MVIDLLGIEFDIKRQLSLMLGEILTFFRFIDRLNAFGLMAMVTVIVTAMSAMASRISSVKLARYRTASTELRSVLRPISGALKNSGNTAKSAR